MKCKLTMQEKLKDLRTERGLTLKELSNATGISDSALGNYENNKDKEISHVNLIKLAKFYGVTTDYLFGLSENKGYENDNIHELNLDDEAIEILKSESINSRLLCEIIKSDYFKRFMSDMEIYVDDIVGSNIRMLNAIVNNARLKIMGMIDVNDTEHYIETLKVSEIDEDDYLGNIIASDIKVIAKNIRESHKNDFETADQHNIINDMLESINSIYSEAPNRNKRFKAWSNMLHIDLNKMTPGEITALSIFFEKYSDLAQPHKKGRGKKS